MRSSRGLVGRGDRRNGRAADRHPRDLPRRRHVALEQEWRGPQRIGDVVEPVRRVIRWQRADVGVDRQQVADGVAVLGPVHPMQQRPSRIRASRRGAVERRLQPGGDRIVGGIVRARPARGRHRAAPELLDDLLPDIGPGLGVRHVELVEREARRPQSLVVAGDAVLLEHRRMIRGDTGRRRLRGGAAHEPHGTTGPREQATPDAPRIPCCLHRFLHRHCAFELTPKRSVWGSQARRGSETPPLNPAGQTRTGRDRPRPQRTACRQPRRRSGRSRLDRRGSSARATHRYWRRAHGNDPRARR